MDFDLESWAQALLSAFTAGRWSLVAVLAIVALVAGARAILVPRVPFFKTDLGGTLLGFVGGTAAALAAALTGGAALGLPALASAATVAFAAMGGWTAVKRLLMPLLGMLLRLLGVGTSPSVTKAEAEKAGDDAVKKNPSDGAGPARDVD